MGCVLSLSITHSYEIAVEVTSDLSLGVAAFCTLVRLMEGECMPDVPSYAAYQEALEGHAGPPAAKRTRDNALSGRCSWDSSSCAVTVRVATTDPYAFPYAENRCATSRPSLL